MDINYVINELVVYGIKKNLINDFDYYYVANQIIGNLHLDSFTKVEVTTLRELHEILEDILDYASTQSIIHDDIISYDLFDTMIMNIFTPLPSLVINEFNSLYKQSSSLATDYLYKLMIDVNYIRMNRIDKNIKWTYNSSYGEILLTINMSKPEKDPKAIALALQNKSTSNYPNCFLCFENMGYYGTLNHPARNNLRVIPIKINNEDFFMQYSPYIYYNEHTIVFKKEHQPMCVNEDTFVRLLDFVDLFNDYFLGSNAGIPIVGGSILSHEHYQGGRFTFPLDNATSLYQKVINNVSIDYLNWPLDTLKLISKSKSDILKVANTIYRSFASYSNPSINIYSETEGVIHNAITPIARYNKETHEYILYMVLRNNLTSDEYPYGIYHPDESLHNIKKENIGLIEVMGLAILPSRLKKELSLLDSIIKGNSSIDRLSEIPLHKDWYKELISIYQDSPSTFDIYQEVGKKFTKVLECCKIFKYGTLDDVISFINLL